MSDSSSVIRAHPDINSLGSGILIALLLCFAALLFIAYHSPFYSLWLQLILTLVFVATLVYFLEGLTESLRCDGTIVSFHAWFKRASPVDVSKVERVVLAHEGLNVEHGIEMMMFQMTDGSRIRFGLGPLWHQHALMNFICELERRSGKSLLIEKF